MKAEIIFAAAYSICLFVYGLVWLWFSAGKEERRRRRYAYRIVALVDLVLATIAVLAIISSKRLTFWPETTSAVVAANALFSFIMRKESTE